MARSVSGSKTDHDQFSGQTLQNVNTFQTSPRPIFQTKYSGMYILLIIEVAMNNFLIKYSRIYVRVLVHSRIRRERFSDDASQSYEHNIALHRLFPFAAYTPSPAAAAAAAIANSVEMCARSSTQTLERLFFRDVVSSDFMRCDGWDAMVLSDDDVVRSSVM